MALSKDESSILFELLLCLLSRDVLINNGSIVEFGEDESIEGFVFSNLFTFSTGVL